MSDRKISADQLVEIARLVANGETTLTEQANLHGLTRERIRQLVNRQDPTAITRGHEAKAAQKESQRRSRERTLHTFKCKVCGVAFQAPMAGRWPTATCSDDCRSAWRKARYLLDPDRRWSHTVAMARWHIKHAGTEGQAPSELAWAQRVVNAADRGERLTTETRFVNRDASGYALVVKALGSEDAADKRIREGIPQ